MLQSSVSNPPRKEFLFWFSNCDRTIASYIYHDKYSLDFQMYPVIGDDGGT